MAEPVYPDESRLRAIFNQVEAHLERRYGVPVVITDVVAPFSGDLDGREIQIDHDQDVASAVFVLIHLFGHTVQWNLSARARVIGTVAQQQPTPELLEELREYEEQACRYSLRLLHDLEIRDVDGWFRISPAATSPTSRTSTRPERRRRSSASGGAARRS